MDYPKISVIVPVYKAEQYINRCIESILAQTYSDFELILVDDGSPDECPRICDIFAEKDHRIHVIHKKNEGPSSARNAGLKAARGHYIYFLDADDYIDSDLFLNASILICKYDMVALNYRLVFEHSYETDERVFEKMDIVFESEKELFRMISRDLFEFKIGAFSVWSYFFQKSIIDKYGLCFEEGESYAEDLFFTLCYMMHIGSLVSLPGVYYNYFQHGDSLINRSNKNRFDRLNQLSRNIKNHLLSNVGLPYFKENYSVIHMQIMETELIMARKRNPEVSYRTLSKNMRESITDLAFFRDETLKLKNCLPVLRQLYSRLLARKKYFEYAYYATGAVYYLIGMRIITIIIDLKWRLIHFSAG